MSTPIRYQVLGPCNQEVIVDGIEEALKQGSRMVHLPILRVPSLCRLLRQGKRAIWSYGFDECWVIPSTDPAFPTARLDA